MTRLDVWQLRAVSSCRLGAGFVQLHLSMRCFRVPGPCCVVLWHRKEASLQIAGQTQRRAAILGALVPCSCVVGQQACMLHVCGLLSSLRSLLVAKQPALAQML